jgi:hypothetical protein
MSGYLQNMLSGTNGTFAEFDSSANESVSQYERIRSWLLQRCSKAGPKVVQAKSSPAVFICCDSYSSRAMVEAVPFTLCSAYQRKVA